MNKEVKPTWNYILNDLALYSLVMRVAYGKDVPKQDKVDLEHQIKLLQQENKQLKANRYEAVKFLKNNSFGISYVEISELLSMLERGKGDSKEIREYIESPFSARWGISYELLQSIFDYIDQLETNTDEVIKKLEEVREKRYTLLNEVEELLSILKRGKE